MHKGPQCDHRRWFRRGRADGDVTECVCACVCVPPRPPPCPRTFPIRGFQIYDGPVRLTSSTFRGYVPTAERFTSAVGFSLKNTWQLTPRNNLSRLHFHPSVSTAPPPPPPGPASRPVASV